MISSCVMLREGKDNKILGNIGRMDVKIEKICTKYFDFIRFCIGGTVSVPKSVGENDWDALFSFMKKQALLGVGFRGVERMKAEGVAVPREVVLKWFAVSEQIRMRNEVVDRRCVELVRMLKEAGFDSCILKGQGNAMMYPDKRVRASGDIDIWVDGTREEVMDFVKKTVPHPNMRFHHVDYPIWDDVPVEVHFMPSYMNCVVYNHRLQHWFKARKDEQMTHFVDLPDGVGRIPVLTLEFSLVHQLTHLWHHLFEEGVGLRQMMDYYYLLRKAKNGLEFRDESIECALRHLGLYKFAGAVMWVLHEVFGLEEKYYIVPPDEWRGELLLGEIIKGGNFGQSLGISNHSTGIKYFLKIKRNMRFVRAYPAEALSEPIFRTWHFFWRLSHK